MQHNKTRSTEIVPTSAKARLISAAIWRISMSSRFMSVNHFPYLPIVTNPENNPCIQTVIWIATKIYSVVHWTIANLPWKFHANPFRSLCTKLLTDRHTDNDDYISSLAEVLTIFMLSRVLTISDNLTFESLLSHALVNFMTTTSHHLQ